jgi:hypothetical protein
MTENLSYKLQIDGVERKTIEINTLTGSESLHLTNFDGVKHLVKNLFILVIK